MSFIVAVKHPRWDGQDNWAFVECQNKAQAYQLRLAAKRLSKRFRVVKVGEVISYEEAMLGLELEELKRHPWVLKIISECANDS
jgi:hypothetical protein